MIRTILFLSFTALLSHTSAMSQNTPCRFDEVTLAFVGTAVEQARCLLRPNAIGGVLGAELKKLPDPLEKLIGQKVGISRTELRKFLVKNKLDEMSLGGSLDLHLSHGVRTDGVVMPASYFVIHDTSTPYLKDEPFPADIDTDPLWRGNKLEVWLRNPVAHIFVNRLGESITTTPFDQSVAKGFGTKFARDILKDDAKGTQIHIELIQPRRRDPSNSNPANDRIAPTPGFSSKQYERLALLYVVASVRRGTWLIPAYHSAIDAGIKGAHDDPQNFELKKFAEEFK
jgi:hypothetical protein